MRALPGVTLTDAMVTTSIVDEDPAPAYDSGHTYVKGDKAYVVATNFHRVFQSLQDANEDHDPVTDDEAVLWWKDIGPTNKWAFADLTRNTRSMSPDPQTYVIVPGQRCDSVALTGLIATQVDIDVVVNGETVRSYSDKLSRRNTRTWSGYYFGQFKFRTVVAHFDVPQYSGVEFHITVANARGDVGVGGIIVGQSIYMGTVAQDASIKKLNFSEVDRDFAGEINTMIQRRTVPTTSQNVLCSLTNLQNMVDLQETANGVPILWSGLDDQGDVTDEPVFQDYFEPLLIVGFYREFTIIPAEGPHFMISPLTLEEV